MRSTAPRTRLLAASLAAGAIVLSIVALPVLGQAGGTAAGPAADAAAPPSEKPGKGPKASKPPEQTVTLTGRVGTRTGPDGGRTTWTLTVGSTVYDLEAGPPWFWRDDHPLAPFAGKTVTVVGEQAAGSMSVDVRTVDGTAIREPGRPPWAGGPKAVGERHPGWAQWKADRAAEKAQRKADGTHGRPSWAGPKTPESEPSPGD